MEFCLNLMSQTPITSTFWIHILPNLLQLLAESIGFSDRNFCWNYICKKYWRIPMMSAKLSRLNTYFAKFITTISYGHLLFWWDFLLQIFLKNANSVFKILTGKCQIVWGNDDSFIMFSTFLIEIPNGVLHNSWVQTPKTLPFEYCAKFITIIN